MASPAAGMIQQLMPLRSDSGQLREFLATCDIALVADAFAQLLAVAATVEEDIGKDHNRPRIPNETFEDVAGYLDRDSLDTMQLACRFMLHFICVRETDKLALRMIPEVHMGETIWCRWLPLTYVDLGQDNKRWFSGTHVLSAFLRLSYCQRVFVDLEEIQRIYYARQLGFECLWGMLFDGLHAKDTSVGAMNVQMAASCAYSVKCCIGAFKSVEEVRVNIADTMLGDPSTFNKVFFGDSARSGVRSLEFRTKYAIEVDIDEALAIGFAKPAAGGDRRLEGVQLTAENDILTEIRKKASELVGQQQIDFTFRICKHRPSGNAYLTGFEQYRKNPGVWIFDDLQNGIRVEVKETKKFIRIHAHSSA